MTRRDKIVRALDALLVFICVGVIVGIVADYVINRTGGWWWL